jgi:N-acetylneuraminic acid mutarotase
LEPWPGPERFVAVAGAFGESFYLFSGARLYTDAEGKVVREYLKDAYRFTPGKGWRRLPDLPNPTVAAPSPAPAMGGHGLLVLGGDTGAHVHLKPSDAHPGFSRDILLFDVKTEGWRKVGEMPLGSVTNSAVRWNESFVIPSGEIRPRVRTPQVWSVSEVK